MIDMGPRGGQQGGKIIASGVPVDISQKSNSLTGKYLAKQFNLYQK